MASLIPGFEYDIFISYRQKDNKGDRWVSEFVEALKTELESTFKEEISVYFDINPHDGLLETHDVNASLREKLKCLVFIPIVSRTYCDPKSFAWEHEFKAYISQASEDRFGLKIKLPNGNVSTRILPIRIHELDAHDSSLCESLLGGPLRGVDFIYKSPGVNRPLQSNEDHPKDNLNKTYYRDQINKVANAINDIVQSLMVLDKGPSDRVKRNRTEKVKTELIPTEQLKRLLAGKNPTRRLIILFLFILCLPAAFMIYKTLYQNTNERSLAVIPLRISNSDTSLKNDADYFIEALNDKLNIIKSISLKPTISTLQFRNTEKPLGTIRKELRTNYLIDGSIRREGGEIIIWIELSAARTKKMLWSKAYVWDNSLAHQITGEIVRIVTYHLAAVLSPEEENQIGSEPSKYQTANMNYIAGNAILNDAWFYINYGDKMLDSASFISAIEKYDKVIKEDSMFAVAYAKRAIAIAWGYYDRQLDSTYLEKCRTDIAKALSIDKNLPETQTALGFYYYYCDVDYDKALFYFNKTAEMSPGNYQPLYYLSLVNRRLGKWKEALELTRRVIHLNPQEALFLTNIGYTYSYMHKYDSAITFNQKAIDIVPGWSAAYKSKLQALMLKNGKTSEAQIIIDDAIKNTGDNMVEYIIMNNIYKKNYREAFRIAEISVPADFGVTGAKYIYLAEISTLLDKPENSRSYYDTALVLLNLEINKNDLSYYAHSLAGLAWAGLGNRKKAVEEGEKAILLAGNNKMDESDMKVNLAQIYAMLGEYNTAISQIAFLLNNPSPISETLLKLDPVWKPIMDNREYRKMIKKYYKN
jgi:tetratricopeptide (TPR) repeat protein